MTSEVQTFEQIKKKLNRSIEVIKVVDFTDTAIYIKELMFIKINSCSDKDVTKLSYMQENFNSKMIDSDTTAILFECVQTEDRNNDFIQLLQSNFPNRIEIVRGGSVAIEVINMSNK